MSNIALVIASPAAEPEWNWCTALIGAPAAAFSGTWIAWPLVPAGRWPLAPFRGGATTAGGAGFVLGGEL